MWKNLLYAYTLRFGDFAYFLLKHFPIASMQYASAESNIEFTWNSNQDAVSILLYSKTYNWGRKNIITIVFTCFYTRISKFKLSNFEFLLFLFRLFVNVNNLCACVMCILYIERFFLKQRGGICDFFEYVKTLISSFLVQNSWQVFTPYGTVWYICVHLKIQIHSK